MKCWKPPEAYGVPGTRQTLGSPVKPSAGDAAERGMVACASVGLIGNTLMAGGLVRISLIERGTAGTNTRSPPCGRRSGWRAGASAGLLGGRVAPGAGAGGAHGTQPEGVGLAAVEVLHLVHV